MLLGVVAVWRSVGTVGLIELVSSAVVGLDSSVFGSCLVDSCCDGGVLGLEGCFAELS